MQTQKGDKLDFYAKLRKQYEKAAKPFVYQFSFSEQPKHKKFRILLNKFVDILKEGMRDEYRFEEGNGGSYWIELEKHFATRPEMQFILERIYEVADKKIRIFLALVIHTHQIFNVLETILKDLGYLYVDIKSKRKTYETDVSAISFLKNGQVEVDSSYVRDYLEWLEEITIRKIETKNTIVQLLREMVESVQEGIIEEERRKAEEEQRLLKEAMEKAQREEQDRKRKLQQPHLPETKPSNTPVSSSNKIPAEGTKKLIPQKYQSTPQPPQLSLNEKPRHLKNSQHLFNEHFKDELEVFKYEPHPDPSEKKSECFECRQPLSAGFLMIGSNLNYCNYFGEWYCNDHMAEERVQIPYKAHEEFDLRGYSVSKSGYERIKRYFEKPIIEISYDEPVVKRNRRLYDFLVLRRQLHLMYDSICNSELMDRMLRGRLNYCLKRNLFSLKNLYDIYNGHEEPAVQREFAILAKHFYKCEICQARKGRICAVCNHPPKIFAFELRESHSCALCHKISHRRCLMNNRCPCEFN